MPRAGTGRKRKIIVFLIAISLSLAVARFNKTLVMVNYLEDRVEMHQMVLEGEAFMPYQFHMYLVANVSEWMQDHAGFTALASFDLIYRVGYAVLFLSLWALLATLYRRTSSIVLGLFVLAFYSCLLTPLSFHHPADPFGAALIALTLAAMARGSVVGVALASLAAGFLWSKQVLLAPIVLLYEGLQKRWGRGVALGAVVVAAASVGSLVYQLPDSPVVPEGVLMPAEYIDTLPRALKAHVGFAVPPLLSLLLLRRRLPLTSSLGAIIYPLMLGAYAVHGFFLYELRSFWPVVPAFVCLVAAWGETPLSVDPHDDDGHKRRAQGDD